jgi:unsaturated rhamnogalacturonyl hydrolase
MLDGAADSAAEVIDPLARQTMACEYKVWVYGEAIGLEGLLAADEVLDRKPYFEFVRRLLDAWIEDRSAIQYADHVAPGRVLLDAYERTEHTPYIEQAYRLAEFYAELPRTPEGVALHRPDHDEYAEYVYVDCMQVDAPFLCRLAHVTGNARYFDLAADLLQGHTRVLQHDGTGLFYHLYDASRHQTNGAFWGRGNGWALFGLVDTLTQLPSDHPSYDPLASRLRKQASQLASLQDSSGHWHTVLDDTDTYLESSVSAFFGAGFLRAVWTGLLPQSYMDVADKAWKALLGRIDTPGRVTGVSKATPPGKAEHYNQIDTGGVYPWGQGPALIAAATRVARREE